MSFIEKIKNKNIWAYENIFLVFALVFGIAMAFIGTPFQECDGENHFRRALDVSYGNLLSPIVILNHDSGEAVVPANYTDKYNYRIVEPASGEGKAYKEYLKSIKPSKETMRMYFAEGTMSIFYYPQALGIFIARHIGCSVYGLFVWGKIMNLLAFIALTYTAIRITPVLKNTIIMLALLPMTIYQAASFSHDAILNGLCFLFAGLCFYYAYGDKEELKIKDVLLLGTVLAFIFLCKYVYVILGLLVFIIPMKKFGDKKLYFKKFMIALIPVLLLGIIAMYAAISAITAGQSSVDIQIAAGSTEMSPLQFLMSNPVNIIRVLFYTFCYKLSDYILWLDMLGSLNYPLGPLIYLVPMFMLFVIGSETSDASDRIRRKDKALSFFTFLLISIGIILGIYIGDTRFNYAGDLLVQGVQGRYFIPILPALAFAIAPGKRKSEDKLFTYKLYAVELLILCMAVYFLRINCY